MFSFRTTPLVEQLDKTLYQGRVGCFCTPNCWRTDQKRYMWDIFRERGNLAKLFLPADAELSASSDHIVFNADDLAELDAVIIEIQDVGARSFTYTQDVMSLLESVCAMQNPPSVYVVDHMNPAGRVVEGTIPESPLPEYRVVEHTPRVAHRHGLTIGELCNLYYCEIGAKFPLHVISALATETNKELLPWTIAPSGDIPGLFTCEMYSGGSLWNCTNIIPGTGTPRPYEYIGAPFIRHDSVLPPDADGVMVRPCCFTPSSGRYAGRRCNGYQLMLEAGTGYHSLLHTLDLLRFFKERYTEFRLETGFRSTLADPFLMDYVLGQTDSDALRSYVKTAEQKWIRKARKYVLYDDQPFRLK